MYKSVEMQWTWNMKVLFKLESVSPVDWNRNVFINKEASSF